MSFATTIAALSTTPASNGPPGGDQRSTADDVLRQWAAFIKMLCSQGADIASASTITPPQEGSVFDVTGTTAITTIASTNSWNGRVIFLQFDGILTLTHSSNLYLSGAGNIDTVAGDIAGFVQRGTGAWQLVCYTRKSGALVPINVIASGLLVTGTSTLQGNVTTAVNQYLLVGGATALGSDAPLQIDAPDSAICMELRNNETNATTKIARTCVSRYTNAETPFALIGGSSTATINSVDIGGGASTLAPATRVRLWSGALNGSADQGTIGLELDADSNTVVTVQTTPPTLESNRNMVFNLTSNTNLRVSVRGTDGVTRVANITLA